MIHIHNYKPILSQYRTFSTRRIIFECSKCGKKKVVKEYRSYEGGIPFSIETESLVESHEFQKVLLSKEILGREGALKIVKPWMF